MICFGSLFSEEEQPRALGIASSAMFGGAGSGDLSWRRNRTALGRARDLPGGGRCDGAGHVVHDPCRAAAIHTDAAAFSTGFLAAPEKS